MSRTQAGCPFRSAVVTPGATTFPTSASVLDTRSPLILNSSISSSVFGLIIFYSDTFEKLHTGTSCQTTCLHKSVIMAHKQVTLNLLERIENNTYKGMLAINDVNGKVSRATAR